MTCIEQILVALVSSAVMKLIHLKCILQSDGSKLARIRQAGNHHLKRLKTTSVMLLRM